MPVKEVHLFDSSNAPLLVAGIRIELFDANTGTLLDVQNSVNLSPGNTGPSASWGAVLTFHAIANPLDLYISDPTYQYPGNTVRSLNGALPDRIDLDLLKMPSTPGNRSGLSEGMTAAGLARWVAREKKWTTEEKRAVQNLIFNYISIVVARVIEFGYLPAELSGVAQNWGESLRMIGIDPDALSS